MSDTTTKTEPWIVVLPFSQAIRLDSDSVIATRQCLELAELHHYGTRESYVRLIRDYLAQLEQMAGVERP